MCRLDGILTRTHAQEAFLRYDSLVEALARIEYPIDRMTIELKIMPRETPLLKPCDGSETPEIYRRAASRLPRVSGCPEYTRLHTRPDHPTIQQSLIYISMNFFFSAF